MKRLFVVIAICSMALGVASCGGDKHSRALNEANEIVDEVITKIDEAKNCDALKTAIRGLDKLYSMENYNDLTDEDLKTLTQKSSDHKALKEKELQCNQEEIIEENLNGESRPDMEPSPDFEEEYE